MYVGRVRTDSPQKTKKQNYVVVSLLKQLELLLSQDDIYCQVFGSKQKHAADVLARYEDGSEYKSNPLFASHSKALQIHLYLNEAQVCDVLGSKTFTNKLAFVYFSLGNIEVKFRSNLKSIFLLSIFRNHQVKVYGLNCLLRPFVDEIKQLENGVNFRIGSHSKLVYGTVTIFTANNLGAHEEASFKIGFAWAFRKCRYCLASNEQIQRAFCDCEILYRTKETHALHCRGLKSNAAEHFE